MDNNFLNIDDLSFEYENNISILNNISFSLSKGATLAIVGASGCGKSTLLRILSGILPNSKSSNLTGEISIGNNTVNAYRQSGKLSFMFQDATLMPNLTVKQNIELPQKIHKNLKDKKCNKLLQIVGLNDFSDYYPKQLSGGMKTRVALARSFSTKPELLLLDEPFSALDIAWKSKLYLELEKLRQESNTTVIIVTHDVQEALLLADVIIVMNANGAIEFKKSININYPILNRINDISKFMNSVYENYFSPIQDAIINGQKMKNEK